LIPSCSRHSAIDKSRSLIIVGGCKKCPAACMTAATGVFGRRNEPKRAGDVAERLLCVFRFVSVLARERLLLRYDARQESRFGLAHVPFLVTQKIEGSLGDLAFELHQRLGCE
jgi:hypothetical protein